MIENFFLSSEDVVYCNDADGWFGAVGHVHNPAEWRLFIDSTKVSLKAVLLRNGNIYPSVPLAGQGQVAGACEYGNEPSGSIKCGEFLD